MEHLYLKTNPFNYLRYYVNGRLCKREPALVIVVTASTVLAGMWIFDILLQPEKLSVRMKRSLFKFLRKVPFIARQIEEQMTKIHNDFEKSAIKRSGSIPYIQELPSSGLRHDEIVKKVKQYLDLGEYDWKKGFVSGAVYKFDEELVELLTSVYGLASYTNPLHSDIFPGVVKMEAEVVKMSLSLFNAPPGGCGTMTGGGTESILMACKACRDYGRDIRGIKNPEMIIPRTAHPAFEKAANYFNITIRYIPVDPVTLTVPVRSVAAAISGNTIMIVGSAPNYPYGTMDDIQSLAELGLRNKIPVHVDCCLGGFLAPFMIKAGYDFPKFDFSLEGVTSISADTHKYAFAPKGSSVVMYRHNKLRSYQYCVSTDWPGGVYGSPSVNGSKAGGIIAACWATLMYHGVDGYVESTKKIVATAKYIENELRKVENIFIFGKPVTSVIAIGSDVFHIYRLSERLMDKGWNLNGLQFPSGIHICVTYMHTLDGMADRFINDVKEGVSILSENPEKPVEGAMAIYGMSQSLPDRSLVGNITKLFIDSMYMTPIERNEKDITANGI